MWGGDKKSLRREGEGGVEGEQGGNCQEFSLNALHLT